MGNTSHATVKANKQEIITYDPLVESSEELWRYFLTYLTKPVLILDLEVDHNEWQYGQHFPSTIRYIALTFVFAQCVTKALVT
jgi:hypothetical protein